MIQRYDSALKWCCPRKESFCTFFIPLTQWHEFPAQKLKIFLSSLSFWTWHYFQRVLIMKQVALEKFLKKKHKDVSRTIATAKMQLFVALVSSFQPLTNFTKNPKIGSKAVANAPLQYYNVFWNLCMWSN